ncbi:MAG: hypothetical protein WA549_10190 [Thermoplasmata archaeon]
MSASESATLGTPTIPPQSAAPTETPSPPPPPAPLQPAPRKGRLSKNTGIAIATVAVIAIVILALFLTGVIPGLKSSSSSTLNAREYTVTFSESGLPSGTSWSVTLAGTTESSTTNSIAFSETNGSYPFTITATAGYAASPSSGHAVIAGAALTEPIIFATGYTLTFTETGLPSATMWSVTLNSTTLSSSTASIVFTLTNGMYSYSIPAADAYVASPASGSVTVIGADQIVMVTFSLVPPPGYGVTFTESGLPSGTMWSVTLAGTPQTSATTTITFTEGNSTYAYSVGSITGQMATPSNGNVTVNGAPVGVTIDFTAITDFSGPQYPVTFDQTGLSATDIWGAYSEANSSILLIFGGFNSGPKLEYSAPNGSYAWDAYTYALGPNGTSYEVSPFYGNYTVSGQPVTIDVSFLETFYVNFTTTSFTNFQEWNVTINESLSTNDGNGNVTFELSNGTYQFTAASFGYAATPSSGSITVQNGSASRAIVFTKGTTYPVTFTESGLSSGSWVVTLYYGGGELPGSNASGSPIVFDFPAGTYPFEVSPPFDEYYTASPASGNITVTSPGVSQAIVFTAISTYAVTATESGLAPSTTWTLILNESEGSTTVPGSIILDVPAGLNFYTATASGYSYVNGNLTVTTSANTLMILFTAIPPPPTSYNIAFNETGLPTFADWEVDVFSQGSEYCPALSCYNYSFAGYPLNLSLPNGNYTWIAVTETANFTASPMAGYVSVNGASPTNITVTYVNSSADYLVVYIEELYLFDGTGGLPNGTSWSVTLGGQTLSTDAMFLSFLEPNGTTHAYTITPPAGYVAVQSFGSITGYYSPFQGDFNFFPPASPQVAVAFEPKGPLQGGALAIMGGNFSGIHLESAIALARNF